MQEPVQEEEVLKEKEEHTKKEEEQKEKEVHMKEEEALKQAEFGMEDTLMEFELIKMKGAVKEQIILESIRSKVDAKRRFIQEVDRERENHFANENNKCEASVFHPTAIDHEVDASCTVC